MIVDNILQQRKNLIVIGVSKCLLLVKNHFLVLQIKKFSIVFIQRYVLTVWVTNIGPAFEYINEYGFPSMVQVPNYRNRLAQYRWLIEKNEYLILEVILPQRMREDLGANSWKVSFSCCPLIKKAIYFLVFLKCWSK